MSVIDEVVKANEEYARNFALGQLPMPPSRKLAVVACMDARLDIPRLLGLKAGEAHIIRNAGGIADESALRSLIISQDLLGTQEFIFIHHTDCGMLTFKEESYISKLRSQTDASAVAPARFYAFSNLEEDVREQVQKTKFHPWIRKNTVVRGFVYDVKTGKLREVAAQTAAGAV
ncbi:MAG: carbonic anhydrase [Acidobacteriota bacterium]|nr:carbonic anhydrase [Acidobacteriota bacterium]